MNTSYFEHVLSIQKSIRCTYVSSEIDCSGFFQGLYKWIYDSITFLASTSFVTSLHAHSYHSEEKAASTTASALLQTDSYSKTCTALKMVSCMHFLSPFENAPLAKRKECWLVCRKTKRYSIYSYFLMLLLVLKKTRSRHENLRDYKKIMDIMACWEKI